MENKIAQYCHYDTYESTLDELIAHLIEIDGLDRDVIVGMVVDECVESRVYNDQMVSKVEDILFPELENYDDENQYFSNSIIDVVDKIKNIKYYEPISKHIITEEDYNKALEFIN
jgi:hypothetical protein